MRVTDSDRCPRYTGMYGTTQAYFVGIFRQQNQSAAMKRTRQPTKPDMVSMNVWVSRTFRDAVAEKAKRESRDVSKLVRMLLRERYPDLPEE